MKQGSNERKKVVDKVDLNDHLAGELQGTCRQHAHQDAPEKTENRRLFRDAVKCITTSECCRGQHWTFCTILHSDCRVHGQQACSSAWRT